METLDCPNIRIGNGVPTLAPPRPPLGGVPWILGVCPLGVVNLVLGVAGLICLTPGARICGVLGLTICCLTFDAG